LMFRRDLPPNIYLLWNCGHNLFTSIAIRSISDIL
jgi:hypothetical protein